MEKNDIFKKIIEEKKLNDSKKKPKYATRKLSMGLVSCMLGYALLVSPSSAEAAELDNNQEVVEEVVVVDTKEEATNEENIVEEKETPIEETLSDEQAIEEKETQEAPVEEKVNEEVVPQETDKEEKEEVTSKEAIEEDKKEENASELEMDEEVKPEAVAAEEENREAKDISNEVTNQYVSLTKEGHETPGTVKPDDGEAIGWEVSFTTPRGTMAGDYFTIDLSENLSLKGIEPDHENEYPIEINGKTVADGLRLDRSTIKYTFNENVNDERNVRVSVKGFAYVDKTKVPNTTDEKFSIAVGDTKDEKTINVEYRDTYYTEDKLNGVSQFTEFNPKTGEYTQVFYINPESETITTSNRNWATGKVAMFIDGITPDGSPSDVHYTEENTKVSIQKLPAGTDVPSAIIENPVETDEETMVKTVFRDGGIEITFAENGDDKLRHDNIDSPYIVTVKSTAAPSQTGNNVYSRATLYGDGTRFHIMDNSIVTTEGDTEAQGDKVGYFKEHHVYYTKVDGVLQEDQTFTIHSSKTEGFDYDNYFTSKNEIEDFKFVKVDADKLVENPAYNTDGSLARGGYEVGKTKEVTYIYVRDIQHGSFQEHHIYQTLDENGKVIAEETVKKDGTETTGIDENEYSTSKKDQDGNVVTEEKDKDGYKLVEVKATNDNSANLGVKFDGQGSATSGNYVNGEKLEVTYIYQKQKPVAKKGSFKETHVYKTLDFDGNVVEDKTIKEAGKSSEGTKDKTYDSSKVDKVGYELVKVTADQGSDEVKISDDKKSVIPGNYVEDKELAVTYEYVRRPGRFVEKHIYQTVDKDGKVVSTDETVVNPKKDGAPAEGYSNENIETSKNPKDGYNYASETELTSENYVPGQTLEKTYIYTKTQEEPVAKKGSFKETHVYKTLDFDGNVVEDKTIKEAGKSSEGTKDESYTSAKVDKEGYEFTKVTADEGSDEVTISEDGKEVQSGKYVEDKELSVTYEYVKQPGRFVEHHIYQTVDKEGNVVSTDKTVNLPEDGQDPFEGYSSETISTKQRAEEGYTFKEATDIKLQNDDSEKTYTNYVPGKVLEKTYIYTKTQTEWTPIEETGKFQEHHIYITKDKDGKEIKREVVDGDVTGGTKDMTYTTGKVEKDKFKLVRIEKLVENPSYDKDGNETTGNYKPGVKQEITYVYEKTVTPWTELEKPRKQEKPSNSNETDEKIVKENKTNDDIYKVKYVEPSSTSDNVQTGVSSLSGIIATLSASLGGLVVSKKRKNK